MPRYRVIFHGHGFRNETNGEETALGFYTTRFVDARSEAEASSRALGVLHRDPGFRAMSRSLPTESVEVDEVSRVSFWTRRFSPGAGFTFYREDDDED